MNEGETSERKGERVSRERERIEIRGRKGESGREGERGGGGRERQEWRERYRERERESE
jgi:hypothetical protein